MIGMFGPESLTILILVGALIFGGKKLPEVARGLGRAKSEFSKGVR